MRTSEYDAVVVGAGPNGLAAAITLGQAGRRVLVREAAATIGGGVRSAELTRPGVVHDVCAAAFPLGVASRFFRALPLDTHGLTWVHSPAVVAHPLDNGTAVLLDRSVAETAAQLGIDGAAYRRLMDPLVRDWEQITDAVLSPLRPPPIGALPTVALARFGLRGLWSARALAEGIFRDEPARALFAGMAGHSIQRLEAPLSAAFSLFLGLLGHAVGWPIARGGAQTIADSMAAMVGTLGGTIKTNARVDTLDDLPPSPIVLLDTSAWAAGKIAGSRLSTGTQAALARLRHGPGAFKVDWLLDGPIPWRAPACARAATVHLGGTLREIASSESKVARGEHPTDPFVMLVQPSLFDASRAPAGQHTIWAYCHVPVGSTRDVTAAIEAQVERFAPGFQQRIIARATMSPRDFEQHNANYVGGDISGGTMDLEQLIFRPLRRLDPYRLSNDGLFLCSSATPPGAGAHGLCGYQAARSALGWRRGS